MKATGIVRRIDELGRIVIPKELRKTLKIKEGDPLEIFTQRDGELIFKKYSAMSGIFDLADGYVEALSIATNNIAIITDKDSVIAISGGNKKDYLNKDISNELVDLIDNRKSLIVKLGEKEPIAIKQDDDREYACQVIYPIISNGDSLGSVLIFSKKTSTVITKVEEKIVETAAIFLSKQLED